MSATVSEQFHVRMAKEFVESMTVEEGDQFYLFIGRGTPWPNDGDAVINAMPSPVSSMGNMSFEYWRDMFALVKINVSSDVYHVVPRYSWQENQRYSMYDHRVDVSQLASNTANPFYVINSRNEVFKCIQNGSINALSIGSVSTAEPDTLLVGDVTQLISTDGSPNDYVWKYLYTV
jgi:hypothetical protein